MEQNKVDLFIASMGSKFPSHKLMLIQTQLKNLDDSKLITVQSIEYKDPTTILIVSILLGSLGIDRFMLGQVGMGVGKLLTLGGLGIWAIVDWFIIKDAAKEINYQKFVAQADMDTPSAVHIEQIENQRPQFLTVLCILTFIGVGIMLLISLLGAKSALTTPSLEEIAMQEQGLQMLQAMGGDEDSHLAETFQAAEAHKTLNWALGFAGNILTLIGAIMMWKLKKTGFYLYAIAELFPAIISLFLGGVAATMAALAVFGIGEVGVALIISFLFVFDIAFIVMYAVNLKHMN